MVDHLEHWVRAHFMDMLDEGVCRAIWHLLHQRTVLIEVTEVGGKKAPVDISSGDQHNSAVLAKLLAEKTGETFLDANTVVKKLIEEGHYPLLKADFFIGPENWIIANPWKNEADVPDSMFNLLPLFMGRDHLADKDNWKANTLGYTLVPNPMLNWDEPPPQFFLPDPLNKGQTVENPDKNEADWTAFDAQERDARKEALRVVGGGEGIPSEVFVDCALPHESVVQSVDEVARLVIVDQKSNTER